MSKAAHQPPHQTWPWIVWALSGARSVALVVLVLTLGSVVLIVAAFRSLGAEAERLRAIEYGQIYTLRALGEDGAGRALYDVGFVHRLPQGEENVRMQVAVESPEALRKGGAIRPASLAAVGGILSTEADGRRWYALAFLILPAVFGGLSWMLLADGLRKASRYVRLARNGEIATAEVTKIWQRRVRWRRDTAYRYRFTDPAGQEQRGVSHVHDAARGGARHAVGDAIEIVFDPADPRVSEVAADILRP